MPVRVAILGKGGPVLLGGLAAELSLVLPVVRPPVSPACTHRLPRPACVHAPI
jgi:hypothetical protein